MKFLLDTHCFLWFFLSPHKLSMSVQKILNESNHEIYLSAASSWEIVIKYNTGKLSLPDAPEIYIPSRMAHSNILALDITHRHALHVHALPPLHKDPFDRLLIAQAQSESLTILSIDHIFTHYPVTVLW